MTGRACSIALVLVALVALVAAGCAGGGDAGAPSTIPSTIPATNAIAPPTTGDDGCDEACRFPRFDRSETPLTTADDGNCNAEWAEAYGGDCTNFQWAGMLGDPSVLYQDGRYTMWFTAGERTTEDGEDPSWRAVIASSTSTDGVEWSDPKDAERDVVARLTGGTPGLDEEGIETINVLPHPDGGLVAYFSGGLGVTPSAVYVIGRATSSDGGTTWTKSPTPVMTAELPWEQTFDAGGYDIGGVLEPSVIVEDGRWRMWYVGFGRLPGELAYSQIGYAESTDGITWVKRPDPVLVGEAPFEASGVSHPNVVADPRGGYHLFYVGIGEDEKLRMGHAYSEDGLTWERNPSNPIIVGEEGAFDEGLVGGPSAVFVDGELQLFYMGTTEPDFSRPVRFLRAVAREP